jgi:hypothetical protein
MKPTLTITGYNARMTRILGWLLATTLLTTTALARDVDLTSWQNLGRIAAGQRIEVVKSNHETVKGEFISFVDESISLRVKQQDIAVPRAEVQQVQFAGSRKKAVWIGVAIGAAGGLVIGAVTASRAANESGGDFAGLKPAITAAMGGAGALIGALVGSLVGGHHKTVYQAK